jgi:nucleoid DNA-binding protein
LFLLQNFTRKELKEDIHQITGLTKASINAVLAALPDVITDNLAKGKRVKLFGVGSFYVGHVKERAFNLPTADVVHAHDKAKFVMSMTLKNSLREKGK